MPGAGAHGLALNLTSYRGHLSVAYRLDATLRRDTLDLTGMANLRVQGDFGLVDQLGETDARWSDIRHGKVIASGIDIDVPAPAEATDGNPWRLVGHDGQTTVMYRPDALPESNLRSGVSRLYIRKNGEWKNLQVPGSEPRIKMIDSWVIGAAVSKVRPISSSIPVDRREVRADSDRLKEERNDGPGADERRKYQERYNEEAKRNHRREGRPATDNMFAGNRAYLPGVLFLIDTNTGYYREIRTGQADSEILLVRDGTVYYRVNSSIFSAPIEGDGIGTGHLLIREDWIPDVHWAFWGE